MNLFEAVKESVSVRAAAERYGIKVGRNGMACCPFHLVVADSISFASG